MTTELTLLAWTVVLALVQVFATATVRTQQYGSKWNTGARSRGPADGVLKAWARPRRYAGSGDRRAIAQRVYDALRARARLGWAMGADDGRALVVGASRWLEGRTPEEVDALFTGEGHAPGPLNDAERARIAAPLGDEPDWVKAGGPEWLAGRLEA
ncbi:MAG: hypothetical protein ABIO39_03930, partial [Caulobacteraceae bacterium]